jgi:hypothetical protein
MEHGEEIAGTLFGLLAQVQPMLGEDQLDALEAMIRDGENRRAVQTICTLAAARQQPLPLAARAMVFKLADRLGLHPADLGLLQ